MPGIHPDGERLRAFLDPKFHQFGQHGVPLLIPHRHVDPAYDLPAAPPDVSEIRATEL